MGVMMILIGSILLSVTGCSIQKMPEQDEAEESAGETQETEMPMVTPEPTATPETIVYYDADGNRFEMVVDQRVTKHDYDWET